MNSLPKQPGVSSISSRVELMRMASNASTASSVNTVSQDVVPANIVGVSETKEKALPDTSKKKHHHAWLHVKRSEKRNTISDEQAVMSLIKGLCGTGMFALPQAMKNAGLWTGFILLIVNNAISIYCLHILGRRAQKFCYRTEQASLNYGDVVELSFTYAPQPFSRFARAAKICTITFICLCQLGICAAYLTFIAVNFQQAFDFAVDYSVQMYMSIVLPFLLAAVSLRHLKHISILAMLGNPAQLLCLAITLYYVFQEVPTVKNLPAFGGWGSMPLAFGTIMFSFEAINLILPVENRTRNPSFFLKWNGVLNVSCVLVTIFYVAIGFFGYIRYGENIKDSITLNLPYDEPLARSVKAIIALAVALSYPLQYHVPMDFIAGYLKENYRETPRKRMLLEYSIRYGLTLLIFVFAMVVSSLGLIISLVGAFTGATLALVIPPIVNIVHLYNERLSTKQFKTRVTIDLLVLLYGLVGLVAGTVICIYDIIHATNSSH
ncbi:proton coupled amino acid transporter 4 [Trichuris trichiura]|uniref:Proton coupled amino acid transporter 4 n=1 Tax=Trichuris trichiura TaxID=36087 RepID=A0A077ZK76_TRITR|nr:proton coupled amino acid transporter 4 [Trichuris trichiura]